MKPYIMLLRRGLEMALGRSYWHQPVGMGRHYSPSEVLGYYNDYRCKIQWPGPTDAQGLPLNRSADGVSYHFPTTIFQKALGHWDAWLDSERSDQHHEQPFRSLADWTLTALDPHGGWLVWPQHDVPTPVPYSGMAQGQGISVLVRAHVLTRDGRYLAAARRAASIMTTPIEKGGTASLNNGDLVIEEMPLHEVSTVLNGWINGIFGLHDLALVDPNPAIRDLLSSTARALERLLPRYDAGYWSYYSALGAIATPYYHNRHIAQLEALEQTFDQQSATFRQTRSRFERYRQSVPNRFRAITTKAWQKLRNPPRVTIR